MALGSLALNKALGRYGVTPFKDSLDELMQAARAQATSDAR